jgi:signal transduction histidine kinase
MAGFSDTQSLSTYFRHSSQFYYILTDLKGDFIYVNPLFQKEFDHITDKEKYYNAIQECFKNPLNVISVELEIKSGKGDSSVIRWEFSALTDGKDNPKGIQGIGIHGTYQNSKHDIQELKQLIRTTINGHEKEKQEIGMELRDNIGQHLSTTRLYLEVARDMVSDKGFEIINTAHKAISNIIKEIRQLSQSLVPPAFSDIGLIESVKDICDSLQRTHSFSINFFHRHFNENQLPADLKLMLFRIIQEQINNIIRHAYADRIQIHLESDAEYIILFISDNGKGFDSLDFKKGAGFTSIINRASLFNGQVKVEASPDKGCSLSISMPFTDIEKQEMN